MPGLFGWRPAPLFMGAPQAPGSAFTIKLNDPASGHAAIAAAGDILRMKHHDGASILDNWLKVEPGGVIDPGGSAGYFLYEVKLKTGSPGNFPAGTTVVNYGAAGSGSIRLSSDDSAGSPVIDFATHGGEPWLTYDPSDLPATQYGLRHRMRVGNLKGSYGYSADAYGVGMGLYGSGGTSVLIDDTNGIRMVKDTDVMGQWLPTGGIVVGQVANDKTRLVISGIDGSGHLIYRNSGGSDQRRLHFNASLFRLGAHIDAVSTTGLTFAVANGQSYNGETLDSGDMLLGDSSTNKANILWDASAGEMRFRGGKTPQVIIDTGGKLRAGGGVVTLDSTGIAVGGSAADGGSTSNSYRFLVSSTVYASLRHSYFSTFNDLRLVTEPISGRDGRVTVAGYSPAGREASSYLTAYQGVNRGGEVKASMTAAGASRVDISAGTLAFLGGSVVFTYPPFSSLSMVVDGTLTAAGLLTASAGATVSGTLAASALTASGLLTANGGAKISVQENVDGGNSRGIFMWNEGDPGWGIYMAQSGANKSLAGGTAPAGDGFTAHAVRFRTGGNSTQGFVWENHLEQRLMSLRGSDGYLSLAGAVRAGGRVWAGPGASGSGYIVTAHSLGQNATAQLVSDYGNAFGLAYINCGTNADYALVALGGGGGYITYISVRGTWGTALGAANSYNIYKTGDVYRLENRQAGTRTFHVHYFGHG